MIFKVGFLRRLAILTLLASFVSGCATVPRLSTGRRGILDRQRQSTVQARQGSQSGRSVARSGEQKETSDVALRKIRPFMAGWQWPLDQVRVTSHFGKRGRDFHDGIDLRAPIGTNVYAVDQGRVIYAGDRIGGYGKMVVIRHKGGLASVYAHNSRIRVRVGEKVAQGQKIAVSGNTGRSTGPHLHFEVRYGVVALNPLKVLPEQIRLTSASPKRPKPKKGPIHRVQHQRKVEKSKRTVASRSAAH